MKSTITVERSVSPVRRMALGVDVWPIWECEPSEFPWHYDSAETCYFIEGEVSVTPSGGVPVDFSAGDLAIFPPGMDCVWNVRKRVKKHYKMD